MKKTPKKEKNKAERPLHRKNSKDAFKLLKKAPHKEKKVAKRLSNDEKAAPPPQGDKRRKKAPSLFYDLYISAGYSC